MIDSPDTPHPGLLHDTLRSLFSSKTLILWVVICLLALLVMIMAAVVYITTGTDIGSYVDKFYSILEWGGAGGTARNIISDGVMPRVPQAVGAIKDPNVATVPPMSMKLSDPPPSAAIATEGFIPPPVTISTVVERPQT